MGKKYDVIIVGAGPAGIFTAYELIRHRSDLSILMLEKGRDIYSRKCPKHTNGGTCVNCKPCSITTGWAGAGAFSDGKLSLSHEVGGTLPDYIGVESTREMIRYTDDIYLKFGADSAIHGLTETLAMREIRRKSIEANLKLVQCPVRHLGTEKTQVLYRSLFEHLTNNGVEVQFNILVTDFLIEGQNAAGVKSVDKTFQGKHVVLAIGRDGSDWLMKKCVSLAIPTEVGIVDIGVRLECRNEVMQEINENFYEAKLIHYTRTFDDKVRTFCSNPGGFVSSEYYDNNLAVVNGHSYKDLKSENTNFALLVSQKFTEPFNAPIEYGRHIARLANMLTRNKIMVQAIWGSRQGTTDHFRPPLSEQYCTNPQRCGSWRSKPGSAPPHPLRHYRNDQIARQGKPGIGQ